MRAFCIVSKPLYVIFFLLFCVSVCLSAIAGNIFGNVELIRQRNVMWLKVTFCAYLRLIFKL